MEIAQENDNELFLKVNPLKNIDVLSLHFWIAIILIGSFLQFKSLLFLLNLYLVLLFFFLVPGYIWYLLYPMRIHINREQNKIELQNITLSGSNNPKYLRYFFDLRPIEIPLDVIAKLEFNKSAPNIWSAIPLWYNPGITFYLNNNEYVTIVGYIFAFPSFEKIGQKIAKFTGVQLEM